MLTKRLKLADRQSAARGIFAENARSIVESVYDIPVRNGRDEVQQRIARLLHDVNRRDRFHHNDSDNEVSITTSISVI